MRNAVTQSHDLSQLWKVVPQFRHRALGIVLGLGKYFELPLDGRPELVVREEFLQRPSRRESDNSL